MSTPLGGDKVEQGWAANGNAKKEVFNCQTEDGLTWRTLDICNNFFYNIVTKQRIRK